jgi:hypothetical protein
MGSSENRAGAIRKYEYLPDRRKENVVEALYTATIFWKPLSKFCDIDRVNARPTRMPVVACSAIVSSVL